MQARVTETPSEPIARGSLEWLLMDEALGLAREAGARGEVPVGAIVALDGRIVGRGSNRPIAACDPTAHAEIVALREAARTAGNYRLPGAVMAVTLEPCIMCLGAMVQARIARLVYAAPDARLGATAFVAGVGDGAALNHRIEILGGLRDAEAASILQGFFRERRGPV